MGYWILALLVVSMMLVSCGKEAILPTPNTEPISFIDPDTARITLPFSSADRTLALEVEFQLDVNLDSMWLDWARSSDDTLNPALLQREFQRGFRKDSSFRTRTYTYTEPFTIPAGVDSTESLWLRFRIYGWERDTIWQPDSLRINPGVPTIRRIDDEIRDYTKELRIDIR